MKPLNKAGFTIVETMLFLGISGLLIMGVLAGTGSSINTQRYRDSVTSLRAFLQGQYSEVSNVRNANTSVMCQGSPVDSRGRSDCVILGRLITTIDNKKLSVRDVIGYTNPNSPQPTDDIAAIKQYNISVSSSGLAETYEVEWGSSMMQDDGNTPIDFSMLIIRSPLSGVIRTFVSIPSTPSTDLDSLVDTTKLTNDAKICVDSNGLLSGTKLAVYINKNATSASGIETLGDDSECK